MSEHTPGPWASVPCQADHGATTVIQGVASNILARVPAGPRAVANAQLIAAAPELLAACERVLLSIEWGYTVDRMTEEEQASTLRAALAKARGEG